MREKYPSKSTVENCYCLKGSCSKEGFGDFKTKDEFENGAVTCLLQGNDTEHVWGQNLPDFVPEGLVDPLPSLGEGHMKVIEKSSGVYTNSLEAVGGVYLIVSAAELYAFAKLVNDGQTSISAKLTADIVVNQTVLKEDGTLNGDGSGFIKWTPIGTDIYRSFVGIFDGQNHTVSGLYFNDSTKDNVGLFGWIGESGVIQNVGVIDSYFTANQDVGGVCGCNGGATIKNCYNRGTVSGQGRAGGVCGSNYSTIQNCYNTGSVSGDSVGGVCGVSIFETIQNCYNTGSVEGRSKVGGVCAENSSSNITNCYNTGSVKGDGKVGGVCAENPSNSITNCFYNTENCSGRDPSENVSGSVIGMTTAQFTSGEVAWRLQDGQTAKDSQVWGQQLSGSIDPAPVLTEATAKRVCKVSFQKNGESGYIEYAARYANPGGMVELPDPPSSETPAFYRWSQSENPDGDEFTGETPVTGDMTVYAVGREMYGPLSVTAPTFHSLTYGYAQPAAQAITIRNSGTSDVTISNVSVSGADFTITGSGKTVPANGTLDTYTIQPMAGLGVGTHTATITVACGDGSEATASVSFTVASASASATVTFDSQGGSAVSSQTVTTGGKATKPANPTKGGCTFGGWYRESSCATAWNFDTDTVTGNITLYAKWISSSGGSTGLGGGNNPPTYPPIVGRPDDGGTTSVVPSNPSQGDKVTIRPKPDIGNELDKVTVTDKNGKPVTVTKNPDGTYTFTQPNGAVKIEASYKPIETQWQNPFRDVPEDAWYYDAVHYVSVRGLMNGYGDGLFGPDDNLSRSQFAQILFNREGKPVISYSMEFEDVPNNMWYTEAIRWAASVGIMIGYGNGLFGPDDDISREQLAVILWRHAGSPAATNQELQFPDAYESSDYALEALAWAVETGIIKGYSDGRLDSRGAVTRAQAAQMLMRYTEGNQE